MADAIANPRAVMVHAQHTLATHRTMMRSRRPGLLTFVAKTGGTCVVHGQGYRFRRRVVHLGITRAVCTDPRRMRTTRDGVSNQIIHHTHRVFIDVYALNTSKTNLVVHARQYENAKAMRTAQKMVKWIIPTGVKPHRGNMLIKVLQYCTNHSVRKRRYGRDIPTATERLTQK